MTDGEGGPTPGPFKYHLELTPAQLKLTHTALRSLLDELGAGAPEVGRVLSEILGKLPDDHAIAAIRLDEELERDLGGGDAPVPRGGEDDPAGDEPPDSVA